MNISNPASEAYIEEVLLERFFQLMQKEHSLGKKRDEKLSAEIDALIVKIREIKDAKKQQNKTRKPRVGARQKRAEKQQ
jgi:hypothetical protein